MFDRNAAIEAFSAAFGNSAKRLEDYCNEVGYPGDVQALSESIQRIQDRVFDEIWRLSEVRKLTQDEMIAVTRKSVAEHEPWINEAGMNGLLQWIAWMSWHEGCVVVPEQPGTVKRWWQIW